MKASFIIPLTMVLAIAILAPKEKELVLMGKLSPPKISSQSITQVSRQPRQPRQPLAKRRYKGPEIEALSVPKMEVENDNPNIGPENGNNVGPENDEDITGLDLDLDPEFLEDPELDSDLDDDEQSDSNLEPEPLNYSPERYREIYDAGIDVIREYHELLQKDKQTLEKLIFLGGVGDYIVRFRNQYQEVIANVISHETHFMRWGSNMWALLDGIAGFLGLGTTLVMHERVELLQEQMSGYMETLRGMIDGSGE